MAISLSAHPGKIEVAPKTGLQLHNMRLFWSARYICPSDVHVHIRPSRPGVRGLEELDAVDFQKGCFCGMVSPEACTEEMDVGCVLRDRISAECGLLSHYILVRKETLDIGLWLGFVSTMDGKRLIEFRRCAWERRW